MANINDLRNNLMESATDYARTCIRDGHTLIQALAKIDESGRHQDTGINKLIDAAVFFTYMQAGLA